MIRAALLALALAAVVAVGKLAWVCVAKLAALLGPEEPGWSEHRTASGPTLHV